MSLPQSTLTINNKEYQLVKTRMHQPVSIYRTEDEFLRVGPSDTITEEMNFHNQLLGYGFPVPPILSHGTENYLMYYTEKSLGASLLGTTFGQDCLSNGRISDEHFADFLTLCTSFATAQIKTSTADRNTESFYLGINMEYAQEELPELQHEILAGFDKLEQRTAQLPYVLTHGDFNPHNLFKDGIIDFGTAHSAPVGYDLVTALYHVQSFPKSGDFESTVMRRYEFTPEQRQQYLDKMDEVFMKANLPKISNFAEDFVWARSVWLTTRIHRLPKLQAWRYDLFKKLLSAYLKDQSVIKILLEYN